MTREPQKRGRDRLLPHCVPAPGVGRNPLGSWEPSVTGPAAERIALSLCGACGPTRGGKSGRARVMFHGTHLQARWTASCAGTALTFPRSWGTAGSQDSLCNRRGDGKREAFVHEYGLWRSATEATFTLSPRVTALFRVSSGDRG
uniref:Uncharacterized protein n=1 Tax=Myotis myotis TaxID=51298 RepID=A0A7J7T6F5_MYOMY|nr:hypothetical protein mMyoMyo1_009129 [Myotis myotis]